MTIYVIDSHPLMCEAIVGLWRKSANQIPVIGLNSLEDLSTSVAIHGPPSLFSIELMLKNTKSSAILNWLKTMHPMVPVVVITELTPTETAKKIRAYKAVKCCIQKLATAADIKIFIEKSLDELMLLRPKNLKLTKKQCQLLLLLQEGLTNQEIAAAHGLSLCTVKVHFARFYKRYHLSNRGQAALFAYNNMPMLLDTIKGDSKVTRHTAVCQHQSTWWGI
jgi:DNA-binding NarL/FixJ family response regulator